MDKWMGSGSSSMEVTRRGTCADGGSSMLPHARFAARRGSSFAIAAFNFRRGGNSCGKCKGKGSVECPGCKGSGKNKKNGNMFERWKCFDCQGFGLISCPSCGKGGLTPEQRGER